MSTYVFQYYNEAMDICLQVYGEKSLLTSRLYINIGIVWEDNKDYVKAYDYFCKWCSVSEHVLGPTHPKTLRAKGVLKEPRYRLVALRISQQDQVVGQDNAHSELSINDEVEDLDDMGDDYNLLNPVAQTWPDDADDDLGALSDYIDLAGVTGDLRDALNEILMTAMGQDHLPPTADGEHHDDSDRDDHDDDEDEGPTWEGEGDGGGGDGGGTDNTGVEDNRDVVAEEEEEEHPDIDWPDNEVTMTSGTSGEGDENSTNQQPPPPH